MRNCEVVDCSVRRASKQTSQIHQASSPSCIMCIGIEYWAMVSVYRDIYQSHVLLLVYARLVAPATLRSICSIRKLRKGHFE
jgi:hypothetical protein